MKDLRDKGLKDRIGDFDDAASLGKAMQDIEKVLLVSTADHCAHAFQFHRLNFQKPFESG